MLSLLFPQLVESIDFVRDNRGIQDEWFGLVLLPIVSFSADGAVAIMYFMRVLFCMKTGEVPGQLVKAFSIDISIQFMLFWTPFLILLAWWIDKPLMLLFGEFCFLYYALEILFCVLYGLHTNTDCLCSVNRG